MTKYIVQGGSPLFGEVHISGAKNAAVAILPAALLVDGVCRIENIPQISAIPAASDLSALNAYALMESPPIAWNTKAVPQMSATNTNIKLLCICFLFMR